MSWHTVPFIRLLIPLLIGLILACFSPSILANYVVFGILVIGVITLYCTSQIRQLSPYQVRGWGVLLSLTLISLGYVRTYWADARHYATHIQHHLEENDSSTYLARVISTPTLKQSSIRLELKLLTKKNNKNKWETINGKVLASFALDSLSSKLKYGDGLLIHAKIKNIEGAINPNAFDAASFYRQKNIYHRAYLAADYWRRMPNADGGQLWYKLVLNWRTYLLKRFNQALGHAPNEYAVAAALVLGVKDALSADLKNAYADTGATHVLAVSGLHVGLVAVLLGFLLRWRRGARGKKYWYEALFLLLGIWSFALLTGGSPSVIRASIMFSFLTIGNALGRHSSIYNTIAASAFLMLIIDPFALWNVGFQLSYLAVIGIVYLQPKIYKWFYSRNRIVDYIWNLTAVSLAAQLATLPISLFYFHQFPIYFWLSGLVVIPLAIVILILGISTLVFSFIPFIFNILSTLLYYCIYLMNAAIFSIQQLPFASWDGFWLEDWEALLCYIIIVCGIIGAQYKRPVWNITALIFVAFLLGNNLVKKYTHAHQSRVFVYKVYRGSTIDFYHGQSSITLADTLHAAPAQIRWVNQNNHWAHAIQHNHILKLHQDSINNAFLYLNRNGLGVFAGQRFAILPRDLTSRPLAANQPLEVDWLLLQGNPYLENLNDLEKIINYNYLVFDASNSPWRLAAWRQQCEAEGIPYIDCSQKGKELPLLED